MSYLKENIKKVRKLYGLTQEKFSELLHVSLAMQKSYEIGKAKPDIIYLNALSTLSGVSEKELVSSDLRLDYLKSKIEEAKLKQAQAIAHEPPYPAELQKSMQQTWEENPRLQQLNQQPPSSLAQMCQDLSQENEKLKEKIVYLENVVKDKEEIIALQRQLLSSGTGNQPAKHFG